MNSRLEQLCQAGLSIWLDRAFADYGTVERALDTYLAEAERVPAQAAESGRWLPGRAGEPARRRRRSAGRGSLRRRFQVVDGRFRGARGLASPRVDLGLVGRRLARIRALPQAPPVADHLAHGATVGVVLSIRRSGPR